MSDFRQNNVSATVWPWVRGGQAKPQTASRPPQVRALIQVVIMLVIAFLLYKFTKHGAVMSKVVLTLAGVVLVCGLFIPPAFAKIEHFGQLLGNWVAIGLTWLLLVPFYYLCFVPGRAIIALRRADPLQRRFPTGDPTYWFPRPPVKDPNQYRKQH